MIIFSWPIIEKSFVTFFSGCSELSYWSKACWVRSGLSIAPTLDRFGRVQVKNDTIEKRWSSVSQFPPLKKRTIVGGVKLWGVYYILHNLRISAERGGGGYPQALPKVINLGIMLELSEILVLVRIPPSCMPRLQKWRTEKKRKDSKRESKKWVSHRDPVECSRLLTRLRLTHKGYALTVLRNDISDTDP